MLQARRVRPMGVGDILDNLVWLYRRNFFALIAVAAVVHVPLSIVQILLGVFAVSAGRSAGEAVIYDLAYFAWSNANWFLILVSDAALVYAVGQRYLGDKPTVGDAYRTVRHRIRNLAKAWLLINGACALLTITVIGIPVAIYFGIRWTFNTQAILVEGFDGRGALSRSSDLVRANWWRTLALVVSIMVATLVFASSTWFWQLMPADIRAIIHAGRIDLRSPIYVAVSTLFAILAAPLSPLANTILYYDLRVRKEGFDLELLAKQRCEELGIPVGSVWRPRRPAGPKIGGRRLWFRRSDIVWKRPGKGRRA